MKKLDASWRCLIIIAVILVGQIVGLMFLVNSVKTEHEYYARGAVVIELDRENDIVVVEDCVGFTWEFTECDDWCLGDGCVMVMDTMGTDEIFDDEIINVHYERIDLLNDLAVAYEE